MASGGLAQLVEHLLCKQGVNGSSPLFSTREKAESSVPRQSTEIFDILVKETNRSNEDTFRLMGGV